MVSRREAKEKEEKVAARGRRGLPLPTSRIPEMQIRLNYRRIVNPFCGDLRYCGRGGEWETTRRDKMRRQRAREKEIFYAESAAGIVHPSPSAHTCAAPIRVHSAPRVSARHGWMHRVGAPLHLRVAATSRDRVADAWCITATAGCAVANMQTSMPARGQTSPSPVRSPRQSPVGPTGGTRRSIQKEVVNHARAYIFVHSALAMSRSLSYCVATR